MARRTIQRLTFVTDAPGFGGAERYVVAMANAAQRRGIEPHIYWTPIPGSDLAAFDSAKEAGVAVTCVPIPRTRGWGGVVSEFRAMLPRQRPDGLIINACGRPRFWILPCLARLAAAPAVWVHQMVDGRDYRRLPPSRFRGTMDGFHWWRVPQAVRHRLAGMAASSVVVLNAEDGSRVVRQQGIDHTKIRIVPHGVDLERFTFRAEGRERLRRAWQIGSGGGPAPFLLGTAVRLVTGKGVEPLIEATALLSRRGIAIRLVVAGDGEDRGSMVQLAERRGISDRVTFAGFVADMPAFHSALDGFALCSVTESFGLSLAEAMACERPVIGTPTAGATRQIEDRRTGRLLRTFEPAELADAIADLAEDPVGCATMGRAGRDSVRRQFSIDLTLERTLRALRGPARERSSLRWPGMGESLFEAMTSEDGPVNGSIIGTTVLRPRCQTPVR
ncbi:MAG: glycosyltransferase family 4 protein [Phycisphaerae bacterium]|nr:glycosyltransferase family 4 protein [Phycisphaerae bacterium]